jgi:hypothetical protein
MVCIGFSCWPISSINFRYILAYRGHARVFLKDLEAIRPSAIIDIIHSGETFQLDEDVKSGMKALRKYRESLPDLQV